MPAKKFSIASLLLKWLEASTLSIQLIMYGPFLVLLIAFMAFAPLIVLWYFVQNPSVWGGMALLTVIATFAWIFYFRREESEAPPVKRGRTVISPQEAKNQSKSRLKR